MPFATTARTDMTGLVTEYLAGRPVKVFFHSQGWSVECNAGVLVDCGTDVFQNLEPLVRALKDAGVERLILEP